MKKDIDVEELRPIVRALRGLLELGKKGHPEGLTLDVVTELTVPLINRMLALIGEKPLHWSKDENGEPILVSE